MAGRPWLLLRGRPAKVAGLTDRARSSVPLGEEEEEAVGEEEGWYRLSGSQSPWVGPCPGPAGDGPGRRSGEEAPRAEGPGGAPLGRSGEGLGEAGWPGAAAGVVEEEWGEEVYPACPRRVREEVEGEVVEAEEEEWS